MIDDETDIKADTNKDSSVQVTDTRRRGKNTLLGRLLSKLKIWR
jgi:hypothetical protein